DFKILESRQHLLDSGQGNHGAGQGEAHAAVALRLDDRHRAGFGDEEVGAADGGGNGQEFLAQVGARRRSEGVRIVGQVLDPHAAGKDLAYLAAVNVQGRNDDVGGLVVAQLEDDL